jgi:hypothetical protein
MREPLWAVGGEQRGVPHWSREWRLYKRAIVVQVAGGVSKRVLEYVSPPEHCPDEEPSILFKAATVAGNRAYLCTQTEVLICDFPSFSIRDVISLPIFNDVHHVAPAPDGRLFVVVTGLDAVAELDPSGTLLRLTNVLGGSVWDRFSQTTDYRKVQTTKPHAAHPNYVFFLDGEPWVTRFEQADAVPLHRKARMRPDFRFSIGRPHDGCIAGNFIYFTTVNGHIVRYGIDDEAGSDIDLNAMRAPVEEERPLGWCRGILPLRDRVWVGFSRIRYTAFRQNVDWVRRGFKAQDRHPPAPTRLACHDLAKRALIDEVNLEEAGLGTVFSVHSGTRSSV